MGENSLKSNKQNKTNLKTFVDRVTKLAIYSRACWDYKREEHVCLACPCLSSESSISHRSWYTVCAPYLLVNENKWIPLLLMLHFQDCRVSSFRLTLPLFCFILKSWEISIPVYSRSPHTYSFLPSLSWTFMICTLPRYSISINYLEWLFLK